MHNNMLVLSPQECPSDLYLFNCLGDSGLDHMIPQWASGWWMCMRTSKALCATDCHWCGAQTSTGDTWKRGNVSGSSQPALTANSTWRKSRMKCSHLSLCITAPYYISKDTLHTNHKLQVANESQLFLQSDIALRHWWKADLASRVDQWWPTRYGLHV